MIGLTITAASIALVGSVVCLVAAFRAVKRAGRRVPRATIELDQGVPVADLSPEPHRGRVRVEEFAHI
jgi:hypothetical protein